MRVRLLKTVCIVLRAGGLIALMIILPGCGSPKTATKAQDANSTCPTTVPQAGSSQPQSTTPATQGGTSTSEAALAQAKAEGKPVMLKFGSGKCIPCIQIEENIKSVKPEYEGKAVFIIVDVYDMREQNLTNQFGIQTIPTSFFIGKDGSIVNSVVGVMDPAQIKQQIDSML